MDQITRACLIIVCRYADKGTLQEFELLMYEQACRTLESVLKDFRKTWENANEFENHPG